jgi:hypothetical protein
MCRSRVFGIGRSGEDEQVRLGLLRTIGESYTRVPSWFRVLAAQPDADLHLWFDQLLPTAVQSDEAIASALGLAPRQYIAWSKQRSPCDRR